MSDTDGKGRCVYCLRADFHTPDCPTELRARAEKAEAEAAREFESGNDWCERALAAEAEKRDVLLRSADAINDQGRELARLRDGIQALADTADRLRFFTVTTDALRALLNPTPEDKP